MKKSTKGPRTSPDKSPKQRFKSVKAYEVMFTIDSQDVKLVLHPSTSAINSRRFLTACHYFDIMWDGNKEAGITLKAAIKHFTQFGFRKALLIIM